MVLRLDVAARSSIFLSALLLFAAGCAEYGPTAPSDPVTRIMSSSRPKDLTNPLGAARTPTLTDPTQIPPQLSISRKRVESLRDMAPSHTTEAVTAGLFWQNARTGRRVRWTLGEDGTWTGDWAELRTIPGQYMIAGVGDFNADNYPDILWEDRTTEAASIWLMHGAYWPGGSVNLPAMPPAWRVAAIADFDGDHVPDIVWQNRTTGERTIWLMDASGWGGRQAELPSVPTYWDIAGAADFDGDGSADLVWQHTITGERLIWLMDGTTWRYEYADLPTVPRYWDIAAVGDADRDGHPDLVWQNTGSGDRVIWLMHGTEWRYTHAALPALHPEWEIAAVAPLGILGPAPAAVTEEPDPTGTTSVTMRARLRTNGLPAIAWFEYREAGTLDFTATPQRALDPASEEVSFSDEVSGLDPEASYEHRVVITNAAATARGQSLWLGPPAVPARLSAAFSLSGGEMPFEVALEWDDVGGASSYTVKRRSDHETDWTTLFSPAASAYFDRSFPVDSARTYHYQVTACNSLGCSMPAQASALTEALLPAPWDVTATPGSTGSITLRWRYLQDSPAVWVLLERRHEDSTYVPVRTTSPRTNSYIDREVNAPNTYFYRLRATVTGEYHPGTLFYRNSVPSDEVTATAFVTYY